MTQEKKRDTRRALVGTAAGPMGDPSLDPTEELGGLVTVSHGPYAETLPVGGSTVAEVRRRFRDRLDIDPGAVAVVDGREVGEDHRVRAGELCTFVRRAGEKGAR
jgi:hypothetical protein